MTTVLVITSCLLATGGALMMVRLLRGPTVYDRLVALDTLLVVVISTVAVEAAVRGEDVNVVLLVAVALVGFISTLAVVRLMPGGRG